MNDHDRPLNKRGKRDAARMGRLLRETDLLPDLVLSSTAVRARTTAELALHAAGYQGELRLERKLYAASGPGILAVISRMADPWVRVMVVAHNPGLEDLLFTLTGSDVPLPTAALAEVSLPVDDWRKLSLDTPGTLARLWRPKEICD